uniref:TPR repeat-containing protein n=1 Tax=Desulfovibrio sp. U5L TaxID=596152 RepID=I2PZ24_9BACT
MPTRKIGFYSFKGGVGRTNLVLNTAYYLSLRGQFVGLLDLDLEAPGLSVVRALDPAYPHIPRPDKGLVDYLEQATRVLNDESRDEPPSVMGMFYQTGLARGASGGVWLAQACGFQGPDKQSVGETSKLYSRLSEKHRYASHTASETIGADALNYIAHCVDNEDVEFCRGEDGDKSENVRLDFLLTDLRTGMTGLADQAVGVLFDELVVVCGLNVQNVKGMLCALDAFHEKTKDLHGDPIDVKVIFSPVPEGEYELIGKRLWHVYEALAEKSNALEDCKSRLLLSLPQAPSGGRFRLANAWPSVPIIHYANYLGVSDDVVLEKFPDSLVAREIRQFVESLFVTTEVVRQQTKERLTEAGMFQGERTSSKRIRTEAFSWARKILRNPPDWAWPIMRPFATNIEEAAPFEKKFLNIVKPKELSMILLNSLAISLAAHDDGLLEYIISSLKLEKISEFQIFSIVKTFEEERTGFLNERDEEEHVANNLLDALCNWIDILRMHGAPIKPDADLLDVILEKQHDSEPIPWNTLALGWIRPTAATDTVARIFHEVLKQDASSLELGLLFLMRIDKSQAAKLQGVDGWFSWWTGQLQADSLSPMGFLLAAENVIEKFEQREYAERLLSLSIERDPANSAVWNSRGNLLQDHLGRYEESEEAYRKAIELDAKKDAPWIGLGNLLQKHLGRYAESEEAYRKAIELDAKKDAPWIGLGNLLQKHPGRYAESEEAYRKAIELDPKEAISWNGLGNLLKGHLGRHEEAETAYRKAIELDPKYAYPWNGLGNLLKDHLGRHEEAETAYRKAIELDPKYAYPWIGLGNLLQDHFGRYEEAETAYRKAIELDPKEAYPWIGLGNLLQDHFGRYEESEAAYRKAIELDPKEAISWNGLGNLLQDHFGRYEESEAAYRKAIELDPKEAISWNGLGNLLQDHFGRYEESEAAYREAIDKETDIPLYPLYNRLQLHRFILSRTDGKILVETRELAAKIDADKPASSSHALMAATLLFVLGETEKARAMFIKVNMKAVPENDIFIYRILAMALGEDETCILPASGPGTVNAITLEEFICFIALGEGITPPTVQAMAIDWIKQTMSTFSPPPGSRDIAQNAIAPAVEKLGLHIP